MIPSSAVLLSSPNTRPSALGCLVQCAHFSIILDRRFYPGRPTIGGRGGRGEATDTTVTFLQGGGVVYEEFYEMTILSGFAFAAGVGIMLFGVSESKFRPTNRP